MEKFFLFFFSLLIVQQTAGQNSVTDNFQYKAIYELSYQPDSTDVESVKTEPMLLYIGDDISRFSSWGTAVGDSLKADVSKTNKGLAAIHQLQKQIPKTDFPYNIFKLRKSGKVYYSERVATDNLLYEEDLPLMNWQIKNATKEVAGYRTQKATTAFAGRTYTAWFTAEIPITEGPHKFSGLPGLIVELSDSRNEYNFRLTSFEQLVPSIEVNFNPGDHMKVEKEEFQQIKRNYDLDPIAALERSGIKIHFNPKQERKAKNDIQEKLERNNNPMELE